MEMLNNADLYNEDNNDKHNGCSKNKGLNQSEANNIEDAIWKTKNMKNTNIKTKVYIALWRR